jgi:hypothetical protein
MVPKAKPEPCSDPQTMWSTIYRVTALFIDRQGAAALVAILVCMTVLGVTGWLGWVAIDRIGIPLSTKVMKTLDALAEQANANTEAIKILNSKVEAVDTKVAVVDANQKTESTAGQERTVLLNEILKEQVRSTTEQVKTTEEQKKTTAAVEALGKRLQP